MAFTRCSHSKLCWVAWWICSWCWHCGLCRVSIWEAANLRNNFPCELLSWICQFRISGGNGRWAGREGTGEARVVRSCKYSKDILDTNRSPDAIVKCKRQVSPLCAPWSWNLERTSPWIGQFQISELEERADWRDRGAHGEGSKRKTFCENNNRCGHNMGAKWDEKWCL